MTVSEQYNAASAAYLQRISASNLSPQTLRGYVSVLRAFSRFLAENSEYPDVETAVSAYRQSLHARGIAPSTMRQYLNTLEIFFSHASLRSFPPSLRYEDGNPIDKSLYPKIPKRPYAQILTDAQIQKLYVNDPPTPFFKHLWPRNFAMVQLCLNEKIRNAELLDLRQRDIDFNSHILTIASGKGRKFREVDLCPLSELALRAYLESGLRPASLSDEDYLFGTTAAHAMQTRGGGREAWHRGTQQWASGVIERTVYAVTGVRDVRSHDLRHVGARVCLNAGESLEALQAELGHANMQTTQIYTSRLGTRRAQGSARETLQKREAAIKYFPAL